MRIENDFYLIEIEREHGRLIRLFDKVGNLELITEPRLSENFRLLLPVPEMHANYILGMEQVLTSSEPTGAHGAKLMWTDPLTNERGEKFDLDVTLWIELVEREVRFRCEVTNRTKHHVADIVSRGRWVDSHVKLFAARKPTLKMSGTFAESANAGCTVFADVNTGQRGIVLANLGNEPLEVVALRLTDNAAGACRIYQPFEPPRETKLPVTLRIPGERLVFVVEA